MNPIFGKIPVSETGKIQKLVKDYLDGAPSLKSLYEFEPSLDSFEKAMLLKRSFPIENREVLSKSLNQQYKESGLLNESLEERIKLIESEDTFTVTTGQQNGILLGPLYTVLKICNTIALAKELKERFPSKNFLPVFWMATEDHDIDEIRSVNVAGRKYTWETQQNGAAGRLSNEGLTDLLKLIKANLDENEGSKLFLEICQKAYELDDLSKATRYLVHSLFEKEGLIIIDADRKELKQVFAPIISNDIFNEVSFQESQKAINQLNRNYKVQVNGREVNFFYLREGYRERIEKTQSGFSTSDGRYIFSEEELKSEIENSPERFSPNVMMRPVYQESILPNLAYFGGGAEVSYWLELKPVFDAHKIAYPILLLRNSVMILDRTNHHRFTNNKLSERDLFLPLSILEKRFALQESEDDLELRAELEVLNQWLDRIEEKASRIHPSLIASAQAMGARFKHQTNRFSLKLIREAKRKERIGENRMKLLYDYIYPNGKLQERQESLLTYCHEFGPGFLDNLIKSQAPVGNSFILMFY